jgi:S1-C subfamily serine protease
VSTPGAPWPGPGRDADSTPTRQPTEATGDPGQGRTGAAGHRAEPAEPPDRSTPAPTTYGSAPAGPDPAGHPGTSEPAEPPAYPAAGVPSGYGPPPYGATPAVRAASDSAGHPDVAGHRAEPPGYPVTGVPAGYGPSGYGPGPEYGGSAAGAPYTGAAGQGHDPTGPAHFDPPYGGPPYGQRPGNPPGHAPRRLSRRLSAGIAALLLALGMGAGVLIGHAAWPTTRADSSLGPASAPLSGGDSSAAAIANKVSPGLVDINVTLGYQQARAAGTGMVLTPNGEVLTNNHVIEGATSISVTDVGNGKTYKADVVGYDRTHDIAVLQLENASGLSTVKLGNSSTVHIGDSVVAVGNAGGAGGTPSYAAGRITAVDQSIVAGEQGSGSSQRLSGLIATDADVVAGDSGGPLVNSSGEVIGMDTAGSAGGSGRFGGPQSGSGQGYAIPIDQAASVAEQIEAGTSSSTVHIGATAFMGIGVADSTDGAQITSVLSGGAAAQAGLVAGDTITAIDGHAIAGGTSLTNLLLTKRPGDTIQVQYLDANGAQHTTSVHLASGPPQ